MKGMEVREKIAALVCLTAIAMVAMGRLSDPENIVVNIVVAISAFVTGSATRRTDERSKTDEKI
jgi:hypothetical protein